jgi:hypothetical protein
VELLAEALLLSGEVRLRVHGGSMWPWLRGGDTLVVRRASAAQLRRGEIALVFQDNRLMAHRVRRVVRNDVGELLLFTRGDALAYDDAPVAPGALLGRVEAIERNGRLLSLNTVPRAMLGRLCSQLSIVSRTAMPIVRAFRNAVSAR